MIIVNTHEAKTKLSYLLKQVEEQHEVIRLCRNGKPIADIVPITEAINPLKSHPELQNGAQILFDPMAPLDEDEWPTGE